MLIFPVAAYVAAAHPAAALLQPTPAEQQAMFTAVQQLLQRAGVQKQDMPSRIISTEAAGANKYKVHMQMVQGDGWFLLTWNGQSWEAQGLQGH